MGLDMYVYMAKKPVMSESKLYDYYDVDGLIIDEEEIDSEMYRQIKPYCSKIRILNHYMNLEHIARDNNLREVHMCGFWNGEYQFEDADSREAFPKKYINVSPEEMKQKYTVDREGIAYVSCLEEVMYWRKEYRLQDWIHQMIHSNIENTGYYILEEEFIREYNKMNPGYQMPLISVTGESALFYHEWY